MIRGVAWCLVVAAAAGCTYQRAFISYSESGEDVRLAATDLEGRKLGPVSANQGGAIWASCTKVAQGSLWILMDKTRKMGGNAIGEIRWVPQDPKRTTSDPTCKQKWGWFLVWPVLVTPGFMSAKVEGVAYTIPDGAPTRSGVYRIPDDAEGRKALSQRIVEESAHGVRNHAR
jgi:hypothetical protein